MKVARIDRSAVWEGGQSITKSPVAYAAGLIVCYAAMCNTESSNADALSWPGEQSHATYCLASKDRVILVVLKMTYRR